ncbi:MAG: shikimate dehydrogenase [Acinetobacter sp.]|nr:shikimate dehydrogenase [Acinetobacter sp.]
MNTQTQFAVIGNPIEHSRSPQLHHAFAQAMNISLNYSKRLATLDDFEQSVRQFFVQGGKGMNVTVPFKEQAFILCDVLTERAKIAKAVNTLWVENGQLYGDNTDGEGLVQALTALEQKLKSARILIIGAGGATRGVIYPFAQAGVQHITIANRTLARAEQLVADLQPYVGTMQLRSCDLNALAGQYDMVINATSASLSTDSRLTLPQDLQFNFSYEMAYGKASDFLQQAEQRQIPYADGWSMLVGQAIEAFAIWHGVRPALAEFLHIEH